MNNYGIQSQNPTNMGAGGGRTVPLSATQTRQLQYVKELYAALKDDKTVDKRSAVQFLQQCEDVGLVSCDPTKDGECPDPELTKSQAYANYMTMQNDKILRCIPRELRGSGQKKEERMYVRFLKALAHIEKESGNLEKLASWKFNTDCDAVYTRDACNAITVGDSKNSKGGVRKCMFTPAKDQTSVDKIMSAESSDVVTFPKEKRHTDPDMYDLGKCEANAYSLSIQKEESLQKVEALWSDIADMENQLKNNFKSIATVTNPRQVSGPALSAYNRRETLKNRLLMKKAALGGSTKTSNDLMKKSRKAQLKFMIAQKMNDKCREGQDELSEEECLAKTNYQCRTVSLDNGPQDTTSHPSRPLKDTGSKCLSEFSANVAWYWDKDKKRIAMLDPSGAQVGVWRYKTDISRLTKFKKWGSENILSPLGLSSRYDTSEVFTDEMDEHMINNIVRNENKIMNAFATFVSNQSIIANMTLNPNPGDADEMAKLKKENEKLNKTIQKASVELETDDPALNAVIMNIGQKIAVEYNCLDALPVVMGFDEAVTGHLKHVALYFSYLSVIGGERVRYISDIQKRHEARSMQEFVRKDLQKDMDRAQHAYVNNEANVNDGYNTVFADRKIDLRTAQPLGRLAMFISNKPSTEEVVNVPPYTLQNQDVNGWMKDHLLNTVPAGKVAIAALRMPFYVANLPLRGPVMGGINDDKLYFATPADLFQKLYSFAQATLGTDKARGGYEKNTNDATDCDNLAKRVTEYEAAMQQAMKAILLMYGALPGTGPGDTRLPGTISYESGNDYTATSDIATEKAAGNPAPGNPKVVPVNLIYEGAQRKKEGALKIAPYDADAAGAGAAVAVATHWINMDSALKLDTEKPAAAAIEFVHADSPNYLAGVNNDHLLRCMVPTAVPHDYNIYAGANQRTPDAYKLNMETLAAGAALTDNQKRAIAAITLATVVGRNAPMIAAPSKGGKVYKTDGTTFEDSKSGGGKTAYDGMAVLLNMTSKIGEANFEETSDLHAMANMDPSYAVGMVMMLAYLYQQLEFKLAAAAAVKGGITAFHFEDVHKHLREITDGEHLVRLKAAFTKLLMPNVTVSPILLTQLSSEEYGEEEDDAASDLSSESDFDVNEFYRTYYDSKPAERGGRAAAMSSDSASNLSTEM